MDLSNFYTLDFETTDVDPKIAVPCEVAIFQGFWDNFDQAWFYGGLINPEVPLKPEVSAVHHITDEDVAVSYTWPQTKAHMAEVFKDRTPIPYFVAHNAEYEKTVLGADFPPVIWICTYKCALRIWPDAPNHKNETLRYFLKLGETRGRKGYQATHSAGHDARVTFLILRELLKHATVQQLVEWTEQPAKLPRMPMGKHRGEAWDQVPIGYLTWMLQQKDMSTDLLFCAREEVERRKKG